MSVKTKTLCLSPPELPDAGSLRSQIESAIVFKVTGRVAAVAGESIELEGMTAPIGAICQIETNLGQRTRGRVIGFNGVRPVLAPLDTLELVTAGDSVRLLDNQQHLLVGDDLCGRILDALGEPIDGAPLSARLIRRKADQKPPTSLERSAIDQPFETGVRVIDGMLTCGKGQRLGVFAGSGVGKSTLLAMIANGCDADRVVIAMVGERGREVKEFVENVLGQNGMTRSVVVVATSDKPAAQRVAAAWTATSIAESFRDQGHHVLLLFDSITRFATAQRELGLAAGEPPTVRGYPPSVFQVLPRLVERTGRNASGAITAFYTVLVEGDDPNEPIADSLRGLLDGHLVLSRELAEAAIYPPIDVLQSISRLQPKLVDREMLDRVGAIRHHLSVYRKNADLISIGAYRKGADENLDAAVAIDEVFRKYVKQDWRDTVSISKSQEQLLRVIDTATEFSRPDSTPSLSKYDPIGTSVDL